MVSVSRKKKIQYGGSKGKKPGKVEFDPTQTQGSFKRGAFAAGRATKSAAKVVGKVGIGVVTSPLTVAPGIAAAALAGTGHLALAGVKSLIHAPVTLGKRIMEHSARNKLRKELGVAYPESQRKLGQIEEKKQEYDNEHNKKVAELFKKSGKKGYEQDKFDTELAKLQAEKDKKTQALFSTLSQFHRKKGLGGVSEYTTSFFGRSKKKGETPGYTPLNSTQYTDTEKTRNEFFAARLKKAQNNLEQSYEAGKQQHSKKQAEFITTQTFLDLKNKFKERKNELDNKKNIVNSENEKVAELQKNSNSNPNDYSKKYALELGKKDLAKALQSKKDAETAAIEAEKALLKQTPKDIEFYEGKYYNRKQSRKNSQSSWKKNFTNAGRTFKNAGRMFTPGLGFGLNTALYRKNQTQLNINAAKSAASKNKYGSEYSLRSSFDIKTFGFGKITSKHDQSKKIGSVLFDNQKTLTVLEADIIQVKADLKNATTPDEKRDKLKQLYSLISDKNLRTQLLRSGEKLSMNLINEQEFKDNIEKLKTIIVPQVVQANMDKIKDDNTPISEKITALDTEIKRLDAIAKISSGETYKKTTSDLQVMKQLFTYYNSKDLQGQIQQELSPQRTKLNADLGIKTKSDIERTVESFEKKITKSNEEITNQTNIFEKSKSNLKAAEPAFDIIHNQIKQNLEIIKDNDNIITTNKNNIKAKEKDYYKKEKEIRANEAKIAQNTIKIAKLLAENNTANTSALTQEISNLETVNLGLKTNQSTLSQDIDTLKAEIIEEQSVKDGALAENQDLQKLPNYTNFTSLQSELKANKVKLLKQLTDRESITDQLHKARAKLPMTINPNVPPPPSDDNN